MQKTIPAKNIVTCDKCGYNSEQIPYRFKMNASVQFKGAALDIYGDPACSANFTVDLCDECARVFHNEWRK